MLYIKDRISCEEVQCSVETELEYISLNVSLSPQMSFTLIGVYRPPSAKAVFLDKLKTVFRECNFGKEIIILGDFNINWEDKLSKKTDNLISHN